MKKDSYESIEINPENIENFEMQISILLQDYLPIGQCDNVTSRIIGIFEDSFDIEDYYVEPRTA